MADKDILNLKKQIGLEEEAIAEYKSDIQESTTPEVKALFEHILKDEEEHLAELKEQLRDISGQGEAIKTKEDRQNEGSKIYGSK